MNLNDPPNDELPSTAAPLARAEAPAVPLVPPPADTDQTTTADPLRAPSVPFHAESAEDSAPAFADGAFSHLHPNFIKVERIGSAIFIGFVALGVLIAFPITLLATGSSNIAPWLVLAGGVAFLTLLTWGGIFLPKKSWQHTTYAVSPLGLEIRRGIWWKHMIDVPRSRIQHTDVAQGPLARSYGIGKLIVYTAGTEHASVELDGLEYGRAIQMRDFLLRGGEDDAV